MIENEERTNPESTTLAALAKTLGLTIDWLVARNGVDPDPAAVRAAALAADEKWTKENPVAATGTHGDA